MKEKASEQYDKVKNSEIGGKNIGDLVNPLEKVVNKTIDNHNESKKEQKVTVVTKSFGQQKNVVIRKDVESNYYLSSGYNPNSPRFTFERLDWGGSTFTQETITKGNIKTQGRVGSAIVGGAIAGSVGAIVGGSRKKKSKVDTKSTTTTTETGSKATIYLRKQEDDSIKEIKTTLTTAQANNLERFFAN